MNDHTPTTEEVREEWAYGIQEVDHDGNPVVTLDEAFARFDRWLAAHDRKIAAKALRDAADEIDKTPMPLRTGLPAMLRADWLRARADRIEQGGES